MTTVARTVPVRTKWHNHVLAGRFNLTGFSATVNVVRLCITTQPICSTNEALFIFYKLTCVN